MSDENTQVTPDEEVDTLAETDPTPTQAPEPTPEPEPYDPDSILQSVKASLGLPKDYNPFDNEIIMHINTVLGIVNQLGIGTYGYQISSDDEGSWEEFFAPESAESIFIPEVKTYVSKRTMMFFDPPTSGILMNAMNENIKELEWRIVCKKETP